jgi:ABC-2 type transport system ATP-binding protein
VSDIAIRTHGLSRHFGELRAVDNLELEVPQGIVFGFLGPNGSGKTTTIRLLLGLLDPTSGSAQVLGFDTRTQADEIRQRTGALLEHPGLYERMSARDNLEFYGRIWHIPPAERKARIEQLLTHLGLWDRRDEAVGTWSRGMKQKLAVARAILHRPPLIFFDEPTAGLDPLAAAALRQDIEELVSKDGATVFLTTHNLAEAERLCARVGLIRQGKLLTVGHPDALRAQASGPRVEIIGSGFDEGALSALRAQPEVASVELRNGRLLVSLKQESSASPLVSALVAAGAQVEEVRKDAVSLEQVFLALMEEDK